MAQKTASVNLLKHRGKSVFDRVIEWSLTIGRMIIIITELIALGAFLWRFDLDAKLTDLHSDIKQKQQVLDFLKANEETYRNLQNRLSLAAKLDSSATQTVSLFNGIESKAKGVATVTDITILPNTVTIDANVSSIADLTSFINALKTYPPVQGISIDKIENRTQLNQIQVSITTKIQEQSL